jgi:hypothetical protein
MLLILYTEATGVKYISSSSYYHGKVKKISTLRGVAFRGAPPAEMCSKTYARRPVSSRK